MKIALLFRGQPRFIENNISFLSHKKFILDKYSTDVFIHTWWSKDGGEYDCAPWSGIQNCSIPSERAINILNNIYNPKNMLVEKPRKFKIEDEYGLEKWNKKFSETTSMSNTFSQLYSVNQVCNLVEKEDIKKYNFLVLSRLDNNILNFPDLHQLDPQYFYLESIHPRFPDPIFIFSPKFYKFLYVYDNLRYCIDVAPSESEYLAAETFFQETYKKFYSYDLIRPLEQIETEYVRKQ